MSSKNNKRAVNEGPGAAGAAAAGAQQLTVTLGNNRSSSGTQETPETTAGNPLGGSTDIKMESQASNDPLKTAALHDGPRTSEQAAIDKATALQVDMSTVVETLEVNGDIPQARFGHTITIVSKSKVVLFGGATGDTGKYSMTGETFLYNIMNKAWQKLQGK